ncbi:MAG TPA: membrane dipeptidase [Dongiaceae bacterium]|nr:membrane dipeptidase [Dongiaceae bacterium]
MPDVAASWKVSDAARRLHQDALVWDNHAGFGPDPSVDLEILEHWRAAGVDFLSVNVGYDVIDWRKTVKNIAAFLTWLEARPDRFALVRRADDILAARREGKMAIAFDIEGMNALDGETYMVSFYYRLGVRQMLFAYNRNNLAGGGCHDEDQGLTEFGRRVIAEMNRVGMLVDCSHTGYRTTMQVFEAAAQPVIFSHSNPKALRRHGRNILDEQIRACARTGGVVGINGIGLFLADRNASTESMVDCIRYVADLVGPDHVGIGLDYTPESLESLTEMNPRFWPPAEGYGQGFLRIAEPRQLPEITDMLMARGWPEGDIRKVLGGNFLRVAQAVWK